MKRLIVLFSIVTVLLLNMTACSLSKTTEDIIKSKAKTAITAIKNKDMTKLSKLIHPDKGVRFSPYGQINTDTDVVFTSAQIKAAFTDTKKYTWGSFDGSGAPITLTFGDYYKKFIYDVDFVNAKETGYNKILGQGNSIINITDVYKNSNFIEYHFPGFDPKYQGMDWKSLRLVFEKKGSTWYIVGIIHDQWTI